MTFRKIKIYERNEIILDIYIPNIYKIAKKAF